MKALVFFQQADGVYGFRPHAFDWKVGDRIMAQNGMTKQTIVKITPATPQILKFANTLMAKCKRYAGAGQTTTKWGLTDDMRVVGRSTIKVWNDGTGLGYFLSSIQMLPDFAL